MSAVSIYIASKARHAWKWQALRAAGVPIVAAWIDEAGEGETTDWACLWDLCIRQAASATGFVFYHEGGEIQKGALVELGSALHAGVPVWWIGPEYSTAPKHRLVQRVESVEEAIRQIMGKVFE